MIYHIIDAAVCAGTVLFLGILIGLCRRGGSASMSRSATETARQQEARRTIDRMYDRAEELVHIATDQYRRER